MGWNTENIKIMILSEKRANRSGEQTIVKKCEMLHQCVKRKRL